MTFWTCRTAFGTSGAPSVNCARRSGQSRTVGRRRDTSASPKLGSADIPYMNSMSDTVAWTASAPRGPASCVRPPVSEWRRGVRARWRAAVITHGAVSCVRVSARRAATVVSVSAQEQTYRVGGKAGPIPEARIGSLWDATRGDRWCVERAVATPKAVSALQLWRRDRINSRPLTRRQRHKARNCPLNAAAITLGHTRLRA